MAQRSEWRLVDDLDGSPASVTVCFGLDRREYAVDLSAENAAVLRGIFAGYTGVARPAKRPPTTRSPSTRPTTAARAWARENGHPVAARGPVPAEVMRAYAGRGVRPRPAEPVVVRLPDRPRPRRAVPARGPSRAPARPVSTAGQALDRARGLLRDLARLLRSLAGAALEEVTQLIGTLLAAVRILVDELARARGRPLADSVVARGRPLRLSPQPSFSGDGRGAPGTSAGA